MLVIYTQFCLLTVQKHAAHTAPPPDAESSSSRIIAADHRSCSFIEFVFVHFIFVLTKSGVGGIYTGRKRT